MASLSSRAAEPPQVDPGVLSRWASAATGIYTAVGSWRRARKAEPGGRNPKRRCEARLASHEYRFLSFAVPVPYPVSCEGSVQNLSFVVYLC